MRLYHSCCKVISTAVCSQASARLTNFLVSSERIGKIPGFRKIPCVKRLCKWNLQICDVLKIVALAKMCEK